MRIGGGPESETLSSDFRYAQRIKYNRNIRRTMDRAIPHIFVEWDRQESWVVETLDYRNSALASEEWWRLKPCAFKSVPRCVTPSTFIMLFSSRNASAAQRLVLETNHIKHLVWWDRNRRNQGDLECSSDIGSQRAEESTSQSRR